MYMHVETWSRSPLERGEWLFEQFLTALTVLSEVERTVEAASDSRFIKIAWPTYFILDCHSGDRLSFSNCFACQRKSLSHWLDTLLLTSLLTFCNVRLTDKMCFNSTFCYPHFQVSMIRVSDVFDFFTVIRLLLPKLKHFFDKDILKFQGECVCVIRLFSISFHLSFTSKRTNTLFVSSTTFSWKKIRSLWEDILLLFPRDVMFTRSPLIKTCIIILDGHLILQTSSFCNKIPREISLKSSYDGQKNLTHSWLGNFLDKLTIGLRTDVNFLSSMLPKAVLNLSGLWSLSWRKCHVVNFYDWETRVIILNWLHESLLR